ncbi:MAG: hypothetical protein PHX97_03600, partial [Dehalococcoidales bacterium]|nr:hypothetical protein [Dehalococcoidales bacterium]
LFYQNLISLPEVKKNNKPSSWLKGGFEKEAKSSTKRETMSNPLRNYLSQRTPDRIHKKRIYAKTEYILSQKTIL